MRVDSASRVPFRAAVLTLGLLALLAAGCHASRPATVTELLNPADVAASLQPSQGRQWEPNLAVLPWAVQNAESLTVHNVRNTKYLTADDYIVRHYDKTFDLRRLRSFDFLVVPFRDSSTLAHTMLSFDCGADGYLALSVEARLEAGETYSPLKGALRRYELIYVLADERDVIPLRTKYRRDAVYLYPTKARPEQARAVLLDVVARTNKLRESPEFYDTVPNNCTTSIIRHLSVLRPQGGPAELQAVLPGYIDRLAYDLGLLDTEFWFEKTGQQACINPWANRYEEDPAFSQRIREGRNLAASRTRRL